MDIAEPLLAMVHMTYICEAGKSPYIICITSFFKLLNWKQLSYRCFKNTQVVLNRNK